jgi:hypothetical protein
MTNLKAFLLDNKVCFKMSDGSEHVTSIKTNKNGDYYFVPNYLTKNSKYKLITSFFYCIKDAVQTLENDDGDEIIANKESGVIMVIRYLDREIGDKIRAEQLENYKSAKYGIYVACTDCPIVAVSIDGDTTIDSRKYKYYDTEEEAEKEIQKIYIEAMEAINLGALEDPDFLDTPRNAVLLAAIEDDDKGIHLNDRAFRICQRIL